jgi:TolB-like protein
MPRQNYTAVSLTEDAAEALRRMAILFSSANGTRVTLSEAVIFAEAALSAQQADWRNRRAENTKPKKER